MAGLSPSLQGIWNKCPPFGLFLQQTFGASALQNPLPLLPWTGAAPRVWSAAAQDEISLPAPVEEQKLPWEFQPLPRDSVTIPCTPRWQA